LLLGVQTVHEAGLLHRHVQPDLIVLRATPRGASLVLHGAGLAQLADARPIFAAEYQAPEQGSREALEAGTDLYACGVVLLEMLTGKAKEANLIASQPDSVLPAGLRRLLEGCLAPKRRDRYPDVQTALKVLDEELAS
jgi:serine/threonine-protein kinase